MNTGWVENGVFSYLQKPASETLLVLHCLSRGSLSSPFQSYAEIDQLAAHSSTLIAPVFGPNQDTSLANVEYTQSSIRE